MATLVSFHAHPDDECIACGGVIRKAADEGHRVVLVVATRGERGEVAEGFLDPGEELWQRRVAETHASAEILGAQRVEFLGYTDSGMMGTPANETPGSFWTAPVDEAAKKLAALTAGGHHQHDPVALLGGFADHPAAGDALVIGMSVKRNHRGHGADATRPAGQPAATLHGASALCRVACSSTGRTSRGQA